MSNVGIVNMEETYPTPYGWLMDPDGHEVDAHAFDEYTDDEEDAQDARMWDDRRIADFEDRDDLEELADFTYDAGECDNCGLFVDSLELIASRTYATEQYVCKRCVALALEEWS